MIFFKAENKKRRRKRKKKGYVALSDRPISKNKFKKIKKNQKSGVGVSRNFCQIGWVFSPFREKGGNPPKCYTFECFLKIIIVKKSDRPTQIFAISTSGQHNTFLNSQVQTSYTSKHVVATVCVLPVSIPNTYKTLMKELIRKTKHV